MFLYALKWLHVQSQDTSSLFAMSRHALIKDIWLNVSNFTLTFQVSKLISMDLYEISDPGQPLGQLEWKSKSNII